MNDPAEYSAADALAAVEEARTALLRKVEGGSWRYDLIYSALVAGVVMGQGLPLPFNLLADAAIIVALLVLVRWWRARTGVMISGVMPKGALWAAVGIGLGGCMAAIAAAVAARQGQPSAVLLLGPAAGLLALGASRLRRRAFRTEVEAGVVNEIASRLTWIWPMVAMGLVCGVAAGVMAVRGMDSYVVGLFFGVALALMASPALIALKRRILLR